MTAEDVLLSLQKRWPDDQYLNIREAPEHPDRGGRRLDLLVVSLWKSRGLKLDGVEVKVALSDWRKEAANPRKSDFWWSRVHRFWVAVPMGMAQEVKDTLPEGWGLLSCSESRVRVAVKPVQRRAPEPLGWGTTIGVMRAAADAGVAALHRAHAAGVAEGRSRGVSRDVRAERDLEELRTAVADFEMASGIKIHGWQMGRVGEAVKMLLADRFGAGRRLEDVASAAERLRMHAEGMVHAARRAEELARLVRDAGALVADDSELAT